eukprot:CAMPEP_0113896076 /NCGR_PEP_ID=MMETSP0780_2-20120614/17768_1 /TAXON_ID=652834 /ORGANISM="Palpitomonas bilix" /LENGTH=255 /DNA_ID=CAMNT_0000887079 /DNA_START=187 /DNA_END=954 /DNA_ORIENTATION=+ /assembly_acc=CAM_ASM_000599
MDSPFQKLQQYPPPSLLPRERIPRVSPSPSPIGILVQGGRRHADINKEENKAFLNNKSDSTGAYPPLLPSSLPFVSSVSSVSSESSFSSYHPSESRTVSDVAKPGSEAALTSTSSVSPLVTPLHSRVQTHALQTTAQTLLRVPEMAPEIAPGATPQYLPVLSSLTSDPSVSPTSSAVLFQKPTPAQKRMEQFHRIMNDLEQAKERTRQHKQLFLQEAATTIMAPHRVPSPLSPNRGSYSPMSFLSPSPPPPPPPQ